MGARLQKMRREAADAAQTTIDPFEAGYVYGFVRRALRRRWGVARTLFRGSLAIGLLAALALPNVYRVDSHLLIHYSDRMAAMVAPDRKVPEEKEDLEHKDLLELLYSQDNLGHIIDDFDLPRRFAASRPIWMRLKDALQQRLVGEISESDRHQIFLTMLQKSFSVSVDNEVMSLGIEWNDPQIALGLSEIAVARFLKMRRDIELAQIYDTVRLLERQANMARYESDASVARMQKIFEKKQRELRDDVASDLGAPLPEIVQHVVTVYQPTAAQSRANGAAALLRNQLRGKQGTHASVRRAYEAVLKEAAQKVETLKQSLGPKHPDFIEAQAALQKASQVPAELRLAQDDERRLAAQLRTIARRGGKGAPRVSVQVAAVPEAQEKNASLRKRAAAILQKRLENDSEVKTMLTEIRRREAAYERLAARLEAARLEGDAANVAFESRYILTVPPTLPRAPARPVAVMALGVALVCGLLLGLLGALVADVGSLRVQESWQLQRFLRLRVLGEVDDS